MSARVAVGIDLGTTHCAMARVDLDTEAPPEAVPMVQLIGKNATAERTLLPSFLYFPHASEGLCPLPWDEERAFAVGEYARSRGAEAPLRLVSSAKSWLCHPTLDRRSGILPRGLPTEPTPDDVEAISPVEASYRYLEHLCEAYAATHGGASLADTDVILTVPASFDASARELTVEAALAAGLDGLTLLEEPQAALYAWIAARGAGFRADLHVGDVILVVDVGGGTTDFSAIQVRDAGGAFELVRVAVGDHILLGGDNMDLALAHVARQKLVASGKEVDPAQMVALTHAARAAKERLLSDPAASSAPIAVASRGSNLMGGALRADITQAEVTATLIEGFFPSVEAAARPIARPRGGLMQIGLPYAQDAAVTRHLAAFLGKQAGALGGTSALLCPTAVLFNGGVMKCDRLRARIMDVLGAWAKLEGQPAPRVLEGGDLDHAVAVGAAAYGRVRSGTGIRIRGGTARSYYVGVEAAVPSVPGIEPPIEALCLAPFGMEEGSDAALPDEVFGVVVGEPVRFRFFGSTVRRDDPAGKRLLEWKPGELDELSPIEITLPEGERTLGDIVPVRLAASVTEVGTLLVEAVPMKAKSPTERWKIELSVRGDGEA